jgi:hypothetical protein
VLEELLAMSTDYFKGTSKKKDLMVWSGAAGLSRLQISIFRGSLKTDR